MSAENALNGKVGEVGMIKIDMPMPANCLDCPACNEYLTCAIPVNGRKWGENDVREFGQGRPGWCPMKEQEVVRCRDCIKRKSDKCLLYWNEIMDDETWNDNWYCADGERRENGERATGGKGGGEEN